MSLVDLAEKDELPVHQFMDEETVDWIKINRPDFGVSLTRRLPEELIETVRKYVPDHAWFLSPKGVDAIHGLRHLIRGVFNVYLIDQTNVNAMIAVAVHDIRRKDDKGDENHGKRSADWFKENQEMVLKRFGVLPFEVDLTGVYFAIALHETLYETIEKSREYLDHKTIVDVVKTADALDRYRLPKLKWWINDSFLKLIPSDAIKMVSYELVVKSEEKYLFELSSVDSVLSSIEKISE